jgi:hypothetical protein
MMGRSALPSTDRSTVWLADLIEAAEAVAASAEPCNPATMQAFSHRLAMGADVQTWFEPCAWANTNWRGHDDVMQIRLFRDAQHRALAHQQ